MPQSDRERWNRKYGQGEGPAHFRPKDLLIEHAGLLSGGRALDVACGFGGNALYLAARGYRVDAVDVSEVALRQAQGEARRRGLDDRIRLVQADLDRWWVPPGQYDVILVFYYLNRALWPDLVRGLRPGGLLFQAHRNRRCLKERPDFDPDYLLEVGELRAWAGAAGLEIVYYTEGTPERDYDVRLIGRRPCP
ncbi:MAG: methyltransferase domain-containing protein [Anaerolineae bacterium]